MLLPNSRRFLRAHSQSHQRSKWRQIDLPHESDSASFWFVRWRNQARCNSSLIACATSVMCRTLQNGIGEKPVSSASSTSGSSSATPRKNRAKSGSSNSTLTPSPSPTPKPPSAQSSSTTSSQQKTDSGDDDDDLAGVLKNLALEKYQPIFEQQEVCVSPPSCSQYQKSLAWREKICSNAFLFIVLDKS